LFDVHGQQPVHLRRLPSHDLGDLVARQPSQAQAGGESAAGAVEAPVDAGSSLGLDDLCFQVNENGSGIQSTERKAGYDGKIKAALCGWPVVVV
jgi:hypothetical protein